MKNKLYHRKSTRYNNFDYSSEGLYFITFFTYKRQMYFGSIENGEMHINEFGEILRKEWYKTENIRPDVRLDHFVIMPNHFHAILEITKSDEMNQERAGKFISPKRSIGTIIRGLKSTVTKQIRELNSTLNKDFNFGQDQFRIFHHNYWDRIIRNEKEYLAYQEYMYNNPKKWDEDTLFEK